MKRIRDRYQDLRAMLHGDRVARDVAEEFEHHMRLRIEENVAHGMSAADAHEEALRRIGDMETFAEQTRRIAEANLRDRRRSEWLAIQGETIRRAVRSLVRTPAFSITSLITLSLGLGAATAIFASLNAVVLHPLPYSGPEQLVTVRHPVPGIKAGDRWGLSSASYFHFEKSSRTLADIGVYDHWSTTITNKDGQAERVTGAMATSSLMRTLRFRPLLGRLILPQDELPSAAYAIVLSYDFWVNRYGADSSIVGRDIQVSNRPMQIVGVLSKGNDLPDEHAELWIQEQIDRSATPRNHHHLNAIGRLKPGQTAAGAQAELAHFLRAFPSLYPTAYSDGFVKKSQFGVSVTALRDEVLGGVSRVLWVLFGAVLLVLAVAAANVSNLFLVRADTRQREAAIRLALGAGHSHLLRQYLTEGLLITVTAGVIAIVLAQLALVQVVSAAPEGLPRIREIALLPSTYVFAMLISLLAGVLFGLFPMSRAGQSLSTLREGGRGLTLTRQQHRVRGVLVVAQLGFAMMLLAASGVMVQSVRHLRAVNPGFKASNVLVFDIGLPYNKYQTYETTMQYHHQLTAELAQVAQVASVSAGSTVPLDDPNGCSLVNIENPVPDREKGACVGTIVAAPDYFTALGINVRGSTPTWADMERRDAGVVVTRALAERFWPGENPIGKGLRGNGAIPPFYRVIGVTDDVRDDGLDQAALQAVYFPLIPNTGTMLWQPANNLRYVVRVKSGDPLAVVQAARRAVSALDPTVVLGRPRTLEQIVARSMARVTFAMTLLTIAATMALVLSAVGIYGVITYLVGQRRTEIGIRMALGARSSEVVRMITMQSVRLAIAGVTLGVIGAVFATRLLTSLLFEVSPTDGPTMVLVSAVLVAVAAFAGWIPARRAAAISPLEAMR